MPVGAGVRPGPGACPQHRLPGSAPGPGDLGGAGARQIRHIVLGHSQTGVRGPHDHLERVAAATVRQAEGEQIRAAGRTQRAEVVQAQPGAAAQHPGQRDVAGPGVRGPGASSLRTAPPEDQVRLAVPYFADEGHQQGRVERGVAVAEAHDVRGGGHQSGVAGGTESAALLMYDGGAEAAGQFRRTIRGSVVHDERAPAGRDAGEYPGQGLGLVQTGEDQVDRRRVRFRCGEGRHGFHPTGENRAYQASGPYETRTSSREIGCRARPVAGAWSWRLVPTTTSPSRSAPVNWSCAWSRCYGALGPRPPHPPCDRPDSPPTASAAAPPGRQRTRAYGKGVQPPYLLLATPRAGTQPGGSPAAGGGVGLRRSVDRHRAGAAVASQGRGRSGAAPAYPDGVGRRVPLRVHQHSRYRRGLIMRDMLLIALLVLLGSPPPGSWVWARCGCCAGVRSPPPSPWSRPSR